MQFVLMFVVMLVVLGVKINMIHDHVPYYY
jgi:hypothetical protein